MTSGTAEIAQLFGTPEPQGLNFGSEVYPGYPGVVVAEGQTRTMAWGFPLRLKSMKPTSKPKAVNNTRDDKLLTPMWKASFLERRCLIPVTQWAEAEGETGKMTRTWYALHGSDLFAVAGIWRWSQEWGEVYSMVMTDACSQMTETHDRMPVILKADHWSLWTDGNPDDALSLVRTCDETLTVDRTVEPWVQRKPQATGSLL